MNDGWMGMDRGSSKAAWFLNTAVYHSPPHSSGSPGFQTLVKKGGSPANTSSLPLDYFSLAGLLRSRLKLVVAEDGRDALKQVRRWSMVCPLL